MKKNRTPLLLFVMLLALWGAVGSTTHMYNPIVYFSQMVDDVGYLLRNGTVPMTGNLNGGGNSITNVANLHISNGIIRVANTTNTITGVIYKDSERFIHNFYSPIGGTANPVGQNTFLGVLAGNFTMGSTASYTYEGSYNSGFGYYALPSLTTGFNNLAMGHTAGALISSGYNNVAIGNQALDSVSTGYGNMALGQAALGSITGSENVGVGANAGLYLTNSTVLYIGTGIGNIFIGATAYAANNDQSNSITIGRQAVSLGKNTVVVGNPSITTNRFYGTIEAALPSGTNTCSLEWWAVSNRWAMVQRIGLPNTTTNVTFVSP